MLAGYKCLCMVITCARLRCMRVEALCFLKFAADEQVPANDRKSFFIRFFLLKVLRRCAVVDNCEFEQLRWRYDSRSDHVGG